jgi:hypothetical protein
VYNPQEEENPISNSSDLLAFAEKVTDVCVEVSKRRLDLYLTTHAFSDADVQNISWLFINGKLDSWTDRVMTCFMVNISMREYTQGPIVERFDVPIARLGMALRAVAQADLPKVKYVIAVQSRNYSMSYKILVSQTRKAAGVDLFYELLNGASVAFVGAVLKDVAIPVEHPHKQPAMQFKRVGSVKEAEKLGQGTVGIIC